MVLPLGSIVFPRKVFLGKGLMLKLLPLKSSMKWWSRNLVLLWISLNVTMPWNVEGLRICFCTEDGLEASFGSSSRSGPVSAGGCLGQGILHRPLSLRGIVRLKVVRSGHWLWRPGWLLEFGLCKA